MGLVISFIITFTLLPTLINFVPKKNVSLIKYEKSKITSFFSKLSQEYQKSIFILTGIVILFSIIGISRLEVENSFINYFSQKTEIYKGMKLIDEKLGGTTPLEVILKFPKKKLRLAMMNLKIGKMKIMKKMKKNIGSQKIKLIKLHQFTII